MHWYVDVLRKYAVFEGRSRRMEFWMFVLINAIIQAILNGLQRAADSWILWLLSGLYGLFVLIPGIAVTVRRLHDSNRRGWWWWLWIIPVIGWIWLIVLLCLDSTPGPNRFGPNPKGAQGYGPAPSGVYGPA
jgi:uncharacterized membrane protein YhaH (DUF805 family)